MPGFSLRAALAGLLLLGSAALASAATEIVTLPLLSDRWQYPFNFTPGSRTDGPVFLAPPDYEGFYFNLRDGMNIMQWQSSLPPAFQTAEPFRVTRATLSVWISKTAAFPVGGTTAEGYPRRMELYAAGFGPSYTESVWTGTEAFIGSQGNLVGGLVPRRDPYPRDLLTNHHVEDNLTTATNWAVGQIPVHYVPGAMTDAFRVDFELDVNNPVIQAELLADFTAGRTSWVISGVYDAFDDSNPDPHGGNEIFPRIVMSEGVPFTAAYGVSAQAPSLQIELSHTFPEIDLDESELSFSLGSGFEVDVVAGDGPSTRPLTLSNSGQANLTITSLTWQGTAASQFSLVSPPALPLVIAPGGSQGLVIQFAPSSTEPEYGLEAQLAIGSNDPNQATILVDVSGDAVPVEMSSFSID